MSRRFLYLPEQSETLLKHFRDRWAGKWPKNGVDWTMLDRDKSEVMASIDRKLLDNPHARAEYRDFVRELAGDEPNARCVDPEIVPGHVAAIGQVDADGYEAWNDARASGLSASEE